MEEKPGRTGCPAEAAPVTPPLRWKDTDRQHGTCVCGTAIITGCFGWVHKKNLWVSLGPCPTARPSHGPEDPGLRIQWDVRPPP